MLKELFLLILSLHAAATQTACDCTQSLKGLNSVPSCISASSCTSIVLKQNNIRSIEVGTFKNLPNVYYLNFGDNRIENIKNGTFTGLINLEQLYLYGNNLVNLDTGTFGKLPDLRHLDCSGNNLVSIEAGTFAGTPNLKILYLGRNKLTSIEANAFSGLSKLNLLSLKNNRLEDLKVNTFQYVKNLKTLKLQGNVISYLDAETFYSLANLVNLDIRANPINCTCNVMAMSRWLHDRKDNLTANVDTCSNTNFTIKEVKDTLACEKCYNGTYGPNCAFTCGHCIGSTSCELQTGVCALGCLSGYQGRFCKEKCQTGTYGPNCADTCGHCINGSACDLKTGLCFLGCDDGYRGSVCKEVSGEISSSNNGQDWTLHFIIYSIVCPFVVTFLSVVIILGILRKLRKKVPPNNQPRMEDTRINIPMTRPNNQEVEDISQEYYEEPNNYDFNQGMVHTFQDHYEDLGNIRQGRGLYEPLRKKV